MSSSGPTNLLFSNIEQFISDSHSLLAQGAVMELVGLDDRVAELCEAVMQLSQDERIEHAGQLQKLFGDLTLLGNALAEHRDNVAGEIRGLSQHKKASNAYRAPVIDNKKD